jgi:TolB-like protein/class 3 adenylate cyclase
VAEQHVERRLAAILCADVAGYTRLTGADEEGTIARLRALRHELIDPLIATHRGRVVKRTGDGTLVEFASVVDALRCAIEVQRGVAPRNAVLPEDKRILFRVGINVGDVVVEDADLLGDCVNIAARLESIAQPGTICLSEDAWRQVKDKIAADYLDVGEQALKNVARPVRVFQVAPGAEASPSSGPALPLPNKPSIAVLPFQNMSGDSEQEYFCDGMVEEIITGLSRMKWLFVIARNSSFAYKGKSPDIRQVGRELGVRYVLEGSVRKSANRVRITGQLIDATNGAHIWADRFEGNLEDIFELQDRVAASVVGAIEPALRDAEMQRSQTKPTASLGAYDYYLRALAAFHNSTRANVADALALCREAVKVDPHYAAAYGLAAWCCVRRRTHGWAENPEEERVAAGAFAERAIELGSNDPEALWMGGITGPYFGGAMDRAAEVIERSLAINPNQALAWASLGIVQSFSGAGDKGIESLERAMRLSPLDPEAFTFKSGIALAHFVVGRYVEAASWADRALSEQPRFMLALRLKMASSGLLGRSAEAQDAMRLALSIDPDVTISKSMKVTLLRRPDHRALYAEGLRKAGLAE